MPVGGVDLPTILFVPITDLRDRTKRWHRAGDGKAYPGQGPHCAVLGGEYVSTGRSGIQSPTRRQPMLGEIQGRLVAAFFEQSEGLVEGENLDCCSDVRDAKVVDPRQ